MIWLLFKRWKERLLTHNKVLGSFMSYLRNEDAKHDKEKFENILDFYCLLWTKYYSTELGQAICIIRLIIMENASHCNRNTRNYNCRNFLNISTVSNLSTLSACTRKYILYVDDNGGKFKNTFQFKNSIFVKKEQWEWYTKLSDEDMGLEYYAPHTEWS